jgi:hypothetical protein
MKYYFNIILLFTGAIAGYLISERLQPEPAHLFRERIIRDTIIKINTPEPVIIKSKPEIIYRTDSVFIASPFIVTMDTVFIKDTIRLNYYYPENDLFLSFKKRSDTLRIPSITTVRTEKEKWWLKPLVFVGGALSGYLIKR